MGSVGELLNDEHPCNASQKHGKRCEKRECKDLKVKKKTSQDLSVINVIGPRLSFTVEGESAEKLCF